MYISLICRFSKPLDTGTAPWTSTVRTARWCWTSPGAVSALCSTRSSRLRPLNSSLLGSCDLVTNFGTTEHVGEDVDVDVSSELLEKQFEAFRNLHRLARVGGVMMNMLPLKGCWPQHGAVEYEASFFQALAGESVWSRGSHLLLTHSYIIIYCIGYIWSGDLGCGEALRAMRSYSSRCIDPPTTGPKRRKISFGSCSKMAYEAFDSLKRLKGDAS